MFDHFELQSVFEAVEAHSIIKEDINKHWGREEGANVSSLIKTIYDNAVKNSEVFSKQA